MDDPVYFASSQAAYDLFKANGFCVHLSKPIPIEPQRFWWSVPEPEKPRSHREKAAEDKEFRKIKKRFRSLQRKLGHDMDQFSLELACTGRAHIILNP
jgi:hypothetical protein